MLFSKQPGNKSSRRAPCAARSFGTNIETGIMTRTLARTIAVTATLIGAIAIPSLAQKSTTPNMLAPLSFLAGSCWKGTFAGRNVTDEHCFQWIYDGRFLRDRHVVLGDSVPYEGETTYAWDAPHKQIVYWYIARPGFYSQGTVEPSGHTLLFHDNLRTSQARQLRTTWSGSGPDSYTVRVEEISDGKSKELWSMEMRRSSSAAP